jgi:hypothetical protein
LTSHHESGVDALLAELSAEMLDQRKRLAVITGQIVGLRILAWESLRAAVKRHPDPPELLEELFSTAIANTRNLPTDQGDKALMTASRDAAAEVLETFHNQLLAQFPPPAR